MEEMFNYADQLGPEKIIHVYHPDLDLKAVLVVDNTAAGPALGGVRMAPDVTTTEKISANTRMILERSREQQITPRKAAHELALNRVVKAMSYRRWSRQV